MSFMCDTDHMNSRNSGMRTAPSAMLRAGMPQLSGTNPLRKLGSSINRPTGIAIPSTVDRPRIIRFSRSEPNLFSSHVSNLEGGTSASSSSKNEAE